MALSSVLYRYLWVLPVIITAVIVTVLATTKNHNGVRQIVLAGIGLLLGMTLSYFDYSFTTTFRQLLAKGRGLRFRAVMLAFLLTSLLTAVVYEYKHDSILHPYRPVSLMVSPTTWAVIIGAFLFGNGMQVILMSFMLGALLSTTNTIYKWSAESHELLPTDTLLERWGVQMAVLFQCGLVSVVILISWLVENGIHKHAEEYDGIHFKKELVSLLRSTNDPDNGTPRRSIASLWFAPYLAGVIFALLQLALLMTSGHLWGVLSPLPDLFCDATDFIFGCKEWTYYILHSPTDYMCDTMGVCDVFMTDLFIVIGAFFVSSLRGMFGDGNIKQLGWLSYFTACVGGILCGFGARISFGCNIGALFSGFASFSIHSYVWLVCMLCGTLVGTGWRWLLSLPI